MHTNQKNIKGFFISLEGIEGTGKTTQAMMLSELLVKHGFSVFVTHEPGGTFIGQLIREILLQPEHDNISYITELLLYNADRAQHLAEKILPALEEGKVVITDRFSDSTIAYQGYGRGIDMSLLSSIDSISTGGKKPDITLLFDLDIQIGLGRNRGINKVDRLELENIYFHERVRAGFIEIAKKEPSRVRMIDASLPIADVHETAWKIVNEAMQKKGLLNPSPPPRK
jgi:dTMP kinase